MFKTALFASPPRGIWQLKSLHPQDFAIQGRKNVNGRVVSPMGGGGLGAAGIDWWERERERAIGMGTFVTG